jgi:phage terminase large subunit
MIIEFPRLNKIINETFVPYWDNKDRYLIFYGGRGSSKSDFVSKKLIYDCLTSKHFRFVLVRNTYNSIKDSSYKTIKDNIISLGLQELFEFKLNPLEIRCKNGNEFLARGLDDPTKLKSIKDPSGAWYEEEIPSEEGFTTITTSIRTQRADFLQEIFTINPEVDGDYKEHWFYKKFIGDRVDKKFRAQLSEDIYYSVHQSTYHDNRWLPKEFGQYLESMKQSANPANRYYYTIYTLGEWGNKQTGGLFYKMFDRSSNVNEVHYNELLPIWISFDFNVNPGMHCIISQVQNNTIKVIDEIITKSPNNNTVGLCREIVRRYNDHEAGMFICGDPAGRHEDTRTEHGYNDYSIIKKELNKFSPTIKVDNSHPPVIARGNFINNIFEYNYKDLYIHISPKCVHTITDLLNTKEAQDGTKHKERTKDKDTKVTYEKYGHLSDCLDYQVISSFKKEFKDFIKGDAPSVTKIGRNIQGHTY